MILSETYELVDCLFHDRGTSTNYSEWTSSDFTGSGLQRNDDYTTLTPSDSFDVQYKTFTGDSLVVEFDMQATFTTATNIISFRQDTSSKIAFSQVNLGISDANWHHIKLELRNGSVTPIVDGTSLTAKSSSDIVNRFYIVLDNTNIAELKYKNFMIYPI